MCRIGCFLARWFGRAHCRLCQALAFIAFRRDFHSSSLNRLLDPLDLCRARKENTFHGQFSSEWRGPHQDRRSFGLQRHREGQFVKKFGNLPAAAHMGFPIERTSHINPKIGVDGERLWPDRVASGRRPFHLHRQSASAPAGRHLHQPIRAGRDRTRSFPRSMQHGT